MAILWSKRTASTLYEVRQAGGTLRLYTNGIFHSQWNPTKPLSGHIWDLLTLPAFLMPEKAQRKALVLGVGGGAAINVLNRFFDFETIHGVDLDPVHLQVAKRFFNCKAANTELICDDAGNYIRSSAKKVDLLIEDVFADVPEANSEANNARKSKKYDAMRAFPADDSWFKPLCSRLSRHGVLVTNFATPIALQDCIKNVNFAKHGINQSYRLESLRYENAVGVFSKTKLNWGALSEHLTQVLGKAQARAVLTQTVITKIG